MSDLDKIKEVAHSVHDGKAEPCDEDSDTFKSTMILLGALVLGSTSSRKIAKFTGYNLHWVEERVARARAGGIFTRAGKIRADWMDPEDGAAALLLDTMVVQNLLERTA